MRLVCGICGGHFSVTGFHLNTSFFHSHCHSTHMIHHNFRNILIKLLGDETEDSGSNPDRGSVYIFL